MASPNHLDSLVGGGVQFQNDGVPLPKRPTCNVVGASVVDNEGQNRTDIRLSGPALSVANFAELRSAQSLLGQTMITVADGVTVGDGLGGVFMRRTGTPPADDGRDLIVPTGSTAYWWERMVSAVEARLRASMVVAAVQFATLGEQTQLVSASYVTLATMEVAGCLAGDILVADLCVTMLDQSAGSFCTVLLEFDDGSGLDRWVEFWAAKNVATYNFEQLCISVRYVIPAGYEGHVRVRGRTAVEAQQVSMGGETSTLRLMALRSGNAT